MIISAIKKITEFSLLLYPAAESPQLPLGVECFLPIAGCRVLERSLRLLPEGLHLFMKFRSLIFNHKIVKFIEIKNMGMLHLCEQP